MVAVVCCTPAIQKTTHIEWTLRSISENINALRPTRRTHDHATFLARTKKKRSTEWKWVYCCVD